MTVNHEQKLPEFPSLAPGVTVMRCTTLGGSPYLFTDRAENVEPSPPDPEMLARRAVDSMQLKPIQMGTFPRSAATSDHLGYVGWNSWMWVHNPTDDTYGPITAVATLDGWSVRATAHVTHITWDMGDGTRITCDKGTPWPTHLTRNEPSPTCGHIYHHDGHYTITATSHWSIHWEGIGKTGTLDTQLANTTPVTIAEIQVLNIPPRKR